MGAIAAGVTVFVVSSLVAPLAGAHDADHDAVRHHPGALAQHPADRSAARPVSFDPAANNDTAPASSTSLLTKPGASTTTRKASVDHGVISGLTASGIPAVALNAYRVAAARVDNSDPGCGVEWSLLAGIGREESDHGQFGGAVLHADGLSTPAIIGPALNGKGTQFIPAPPNGLALDGDATYAHALGPMQFIPTTWAIYGTDADGDGAADIFDIDDAALATARYLCIAGGDLRTHDGRVRAVFAYNHTDVYVAQVLALAHAYQTGTPVSGLPDGNTTGSLPGLGHAGAVPPPTPKTKRTTTTEPGTQPGATQPPLRLGGATTTPTRTSAGSPTTSAPRTSQPATTHTPKPSPTRTPSTSPTSKHRPSSSPTSSPSPTPTPSGSTPSDSSSDCPLGLCLP